MSAPIDPGRRQVFLERMRAGDGPIAAARAAKVTKTDPYIWARRGDREVEVELEKAAILDKAMKSGEDPHLNGPNFEAVDQEQAAEMQVEALDALRAAAKSGDIKPADRIAAAKALLEFTERWIVRDHLKTRGKFGPSGEAQAPPAPGLMVASAPATPAETIARFRVVGNGGA